MSEKLNLLSLSGKMRALHLSWFAFFLSFVVWFNHAPLMAVIREYFGLSQQEVKALLIMNVALTIPARIVVGILVDRYGPRILFSSLLAISAVLCWFFAVADSYQALAVSRLLLGFTGAGFVIGIRMIGEWFPARQVGLAEGIYGGWGNFGSAAAAMALPTLALMFGGDEGWRYAIALTGVLAFVYAIIFYRFARNTPKGSTYFKPKETGAMVVTGKGDFFLYLLMNIPMYAALSLLVWKLGPSNLGMLGQGATSAIHAGLVVLYLYQASQIWRINGQVFREEVPAIHRYRFKQVAILDLAYMVTFGTELALVSMLPLFYADTFGVSAVMAGMLAAVYPVLNLVARPAGGLVSDRFGRKLTMTVLFVGIVTGFLIMSRVNASWALPLVVATTILCGIFAKAGSGAVYAMVPLVKRSMTGQIAGMAGAYGNVGGVVFLTVYSFVSTEMFFMFIAATACVVLVAIRFLDEPEGQTAEVMPDGTVQMIDVG